MQTYVINNNFKLSNVIYIGTYYLRIMKFQIILRMDCKILLFKVTFFLPMTTIMTIMTIIRDVLKKEINGFIEFIYF